MAKLLLGVVPGRILAGENAGVPNFGVHPDREDGHVPRGRSVPFSQPEQLARKCAREAVLPPVGSLGVKRLGQRAADNVAGAPAQDRRRVAIDALEDKLAVENQMDGGALIEVRVGEGFHETGAAGAPSFYFFFRARTLRAAASTSFATRPYFSKSSSGWP